MVTEKDFTEGLFAAAREDQERRGARILNEMFAPQSTGIAFGPVALLPVLEEQGTPHPPTRRWAAFRALAAVLVLGVVLALSGLAGCAVRDNGQVEWSDYWPAFPL